MEKDTQDESEVQETTETEAEAVETTEEEETLTKEEIAELRKKADASSQNFERLKKTEADLKEAKAKLKAQAPETSQDGLSNKDILYLAKADIHEDDIDDVLEMARLKKVSVAEAFKFMQPILDTRAEERKSASATQTRSARSTNKTSGTDLLAKAERTGEVPETDEGMLALFEARRSRQFKNHEKK